MTDARSRLLLFGASGAIGGAVGAHADADGWAVVRASRSGRGDAETGAEWLRYDPIEDADGAALDGQAPFDAVCWAQGANMTDSVRAFDAAAHLDLYRANCLSVLASLSALVRRGLLREGGARLAVVSSIWQERARADKLSYTVTKAAIGGLVRSAAVDLGADGHLINGVLPGVLDTPMTAANVPPDAIARVEAKTLHRRLPDLGTLADTILFLCSSRNASITGQSITVDLGMSNAHLV